MYSDFKGPRLFLTVGQSANKRLALARTQEIRVFLDGLPLPRPKVELVISGVQGFLTDPIHISDFFTSFSSVTWCLSVYYPATMAFISIDVLGLIAVISGSRQVETLDQATADFLDGVKRAYTARQSLTGRNAAIGTLHRNRLNNRIGGTNEAFNLFECPLCQRQFLTELSFRNHHLVLHPGTSYTVIIRSFSNNDDPGPDRAWIWDSDTRPHRYPVGHLKTTIFVSWTCRKCGSSLKSHSAAEAHKHRHVQELGPTVSFPDFFIASLQDYDDEPGVKKGVECRFCGVERNVRIIRTHLRDFHRRHLTLDETAYFVKHKEGFKFLCPEAGCGWTFNRYISWMIHNMRCHPASITPGVLESLPEYRSYPPNTPNDPDIDPDIDPEVDPLSDREISDSQEALYEDEDDDDDESLETRPLALPTSIPLPSPADIHISTPQRRTEPPGSPPRLNQPPRTLQSHVFM